MVRSVLTWPLCRNLLAISFALHCLAGLCLSEETIFRNGCGVRFLKLNACRFLVQSASEIGSVARLNFSII